MDEFYKWLIESEGKSHSTAYKYSRAINSISDEFIGERNLYNIGETEEMAKVIEYILKQDSFKRKNTKGHNMYSCALNNFLSYSGCRII